MNEVMTVSVGFRFRSSVAAAALLAVLMALMPLRAPETANASGIGLGFESGLVMVSSGETVTIGVTASGLTPGGADTVQVGLAHDASLVAVSNPSCAGPYAGATVTSLVPVERGEASAFSCTLGGGPTASSGVIARFDLTGLASGQTTIRLLESGPFRSTLIDDGDAVSPGSFGETAVFVDSTAAGFSFSPSNAPLATGESAEVSVVSGPVEPGSTETFQLAIIHDPAQLSISGVQCSDLYTGASLSPLARVENDTATAFVCTLPGGPLEVTGTVATFTLTRVSGGDAALGFVGDGPFRSAFIADGAQVAQGPLGSLSVPDSTPVPTPTPAPIPPTQEPSDPVVVVSPPSPPSNVTGVAGDGQVSLSWSAPVSDGGSPILGYTVFITPLAPSAFFESTGGVIGGLENGVSYTFQVTAVNAAGTSAASASSTPVTPVAPPTPTPVPTNTPTPSPTPEAEEARDFSKVETLHELSEDDREVLQDSVTHAFGADVTVSDDPVELAVDGGVGAITLPVDGIPEGDPSDWDLDLEIGGLQISLTDGAGSAVTILDDGLSVTGSAVLELVDGEFKVNLETPTLVFEPPAPDESELLGTNPEVESIGANFEVALETLPDGSSLSVEYSDDAEAFVESEGTTFTLGAEDMTGTIENPETDIAFVVNVTKTGIGNDQLGDNTTALTVSLAWYESRLAEDKSIVISKESDNGNTYSSEANCTPGGDLVTCTVEFTGEAGGFSTFALLALSLEVIEPATVTPTAVVTVTPTVTTTPMATVVPTPTSEPTPQPTAVPTPTRIPPMSTSTPVATATPVPEPTAAPTPTVTPEPTALSGPTAVPDLTGGGGSSGAPWGWIVVGLVALAAVPSLATALLRMRRA